MHNTNTNIRIIHTGLYGAQAKTVIDRLHGQLSDGKWENSPGYDKYWMNFAVETAEDGEVIFKINTNTTIQYSYRSISNPFYGMSDTDFKKWIAHKIKAVVNDERKEQHAFGEWNRKNTDHISIYLGHIEEKYGDIVTVADIYCTYEVLLGRNVGITKYDSSTINHVIGAMRTDEEIANMKIVNSIHAKYAQQRADLQRAKNEAVAKLEKELQDNINRLAQEEKAELEKIAIA